MRRSISALAVLGWTTSGMAAAAAAAPEATLHLEGFVPVRCSGTVLDTVEQSGATDVIVGFKCNATAAYALRIAGDFESSTLTGRISASPDLQIVRISVPVAHAKTAEIEISASI